MEEFLKPIWESAKVAGPFGTMLMFYVWIRTDKERKDLQEKYDKLSTTTLQTLGDVKEAIRDVNMLLAGRKPHG